MKSFFAKASGSGQGKKAVAIKSQVSVERVEQLKRLSDQLGPMCSSKSNRVAVFSYLQLATDDQLNSLECIINVPEIINNVQNMAKFVRGIITLNGDIYGAIDLGERRLGAQGMLKFRDALSRLVPQESIRSERALLVAWSLWKDTSDVYLDEARIAAYFRLAGLDPPLALQHLKKHPSLPGMYTLPSIETQQNNVDWMIATASVVSSAALPSTDAIGDLDEVQAHAVKNALNKSVSFLHGSAGTGKTKTIGAIINTVLSAKDENTTIVCAAFTHKAVKCIEERIIASGIPLEEITTCTIDSLIGRLDLEANAPQTPSPSAMLPTPGKKPLFAENLYLVLDEASMISLKLISRLSVTLKTTGKRFQLCMVGDVGQLRPIDRGEMFRHMIQSCEDINSRLSTRLDVCYRTSYFDLYDACTSVRNGSFPEKSTEHFDMLACNTEDEITKSLVKCIKAHGTSAQYVAWKNEDVVMISNMVQKWLLTCKQKPEGSDGGVILDESDFYQQRHFLPRGGHLDVKYHVGDRVVFSGNKYKEVSRATLGTVTRVLRKGKDAVGIAVLWDGLGNEMEHRYDTVTVSPPPTPSSNPDDDDGEEAENNMAFMLAYCMTVHKSQGSEFKRVVVACYAMGMQRSFEDRRWLYTAMSRGKEHVTVIGIPKDILAFARKPVPQVPALNIATPI